MKLGDLFISLGFQVKGRQEFKEAEQSLKEGAKDGAKLALVINSVNFAMLALVNNGLRMAVGLKNFALQTALSTEELQKWQHAAVVNDVTAQELTGTIKDLQDVRASFALGEPKNVGAWALLGIDPRQDPFVVLDQLRARLKGIEDVGVARNLAARVGISENVFQMLQSANDEFSQWRRQFELTQTQQDRLIQLNRAWRDLQFNLAAVGAQFAAALAPALELVARLLSWVARQLAAVNRWLSSSNTLAKAARWLLGALAVGFLALGVAIAAAAAALAALSAVMFVFDAALWASGIPEIILLITGVVALLSAAIAGIILVIDDFWTAVDGGKSLFNWNEGLIMTVKNVERLAKALQWVMGVMRDVKNEANRASEDFFSMFFKAQNDFSDRAHPENKGAAWFLPHGGKTTGAGSTVNQNVQVDISVDGARSPETTGKAVGRSVREEVGSAMYQLPVTTQ